MLSPSQQRPVATAVARVHLVTDTRAGRDPLGVVALALEAGVRWVQVRDKTATDREMLTLTERMLALAAPYDATVVVDDRLDVALAAGAHGVHVGEDDLPAAAVRRVLDRALGPGSLLGVTARNAGQAREAQAAGADYVGVGPVFATTTKSGLPAPMGTAALASVSGAVDVPVIAISGVGAAHAAELRASGVHGVAIVSAVSDAADPASAARALVEAYGR